MIERFRNGANMSIAQQVLYFKFLKLMMYVFLILTILCGVFPIMFFIQAGKMETPELGLQALGLTTVGNLGEGETVCAKQFVDTVDSEIQITCPSGEVGLITHAEWGLPNGECGCPVVQQPDASTLDCAPEENLVCAPGSFCYKGRDPNENKECCSSVKLGDGTGYFADLEISANRTCASSHALAIVNGMCLRKSSCKIDLTPGLNYTWEETSYAPCPPNTAYDNQTDGKTYCSTPFTGAGDFSGCGTRPLSSIIRVKCYDKSVLPPYTLP